MSQASIEPPDAGGSTGAAALVALGDAVLDAQSRSGDLADVRLSAPVLRLLRVIDQLPTPGPTAVAGELGIGVPAVSRLVDRAVAAGLVARRNSTRDRREVLLVATRAGQAALREWSETRVNALADAVDGLEPVHRRVLAARLDRVAGPGQAPRAAARSIGPGGDATDPAAATGRVVADLLAAEPGQVCDALTRRVATEVGARSVTLRLTDFRVRTLRTVSWTGPDTRPRDEPVDGPGTVGACLRSGQPTSGHTGDGPVTDVALVAAGERIGVLSVAGSTASRASVERAVTAMGAAFAIALPGLVRGNDELADLRRTSEFTVSAEMQWQQINSRGVDTHRFRIAAQTEPACAAGNESYDWGCTGERVQLAVLDCSGSRERAATATALALGALRNARRGGLGIDRQAELVDQAVWDQFGGRVAVEALLLDLDLTGPVTGTAVTTGQIGLFRHRHGTVTSPELPPALPLGMFTGSRYPTHPLDAAAGDRFVVMTDGLGSLTAPASPSTQDVQDHLLHDRDLLPAEVVRRLLRAVDDDPAGDASAVCIDLNPGTWPG